jgi:hypothetical protein
MSRNDFKNRVEGIKKLRALCKALSLMDMAGHATGKWSKTGDFPEVFG